MSVSTEDLFVRRSGDIIHVLAPRLHFLSGTALQRLHDGATVPFDFQLTISAGVKSNVVGRSLARYMLSYDVWEEKFRVVRLGNFGKLGSHLSASAAEAWCLQNTFVPAGALPTDQPLWARLELRSVETKEQAAITADQGISITTLIQLFSHPIRPQQDHVVLESASFRLADLKQQ
jgi:hypothetical protein